MSYERRIPPGVQVAPSLQRALEEWQAAVVLLDQLDPVTTELVRLRAAAYHDCRACKSLRTTTGSRRRCRRDDERKDRRVRNERSARTPQGGTALRRRDDDPAGPDLPSSSYGSSVSTSPMPSCSS